MKVHLTLLLLTLPFQASASTLYLCKAYAGGQFWSDGHCSKHSALIERMFEVPSGLPFDQRVEVAKQQMRGNEREAHPVVVNPVPQLAPRAECSSLKDRIVQLDAMARQPQTGQMQDHIKDEKKQVRDRQFRLRC